MKMLYLQNWKFHAYYSVQYLHSKQMLSVPFLYMIVQVCGQVSYSSDTSSQIATLQ
jgi:hypothetical protein